MVATTQSNWDDTLLLAQQQLQGFAQREDFWIVIDNIFGAGYDRSKVEASQQAWQAGDFSLLPKIQVLDSASMAGLKAGFSAQTGLIYVNSDLLANPTTDQTAAVLVEEIGHWLDSRINANDTVGDEGELFAAVVNDVNLSSEQLRIIKSEDDSGYVTVNEQTIQVEAHDDYFVNYAPVAITRGSYTVNEGSSIRLDGSGYDEDIYRDAVHSGFGSDNGYSSYTVYGSIVNAYWSIDGRSWSGFSPYYSSNYSGSRNAALTVEDNENSLGYSSTNIYVNNVAPSFLSLSTPQQINEGSSFNFSGSFYDPGLENNHFVHYNFGNGISDRTSLGAGGAGSRNFSRSYTYLNSGTYTLQVQVQDSDGDTSSNLTRTITVNNVAPVFESGIITSSISELDDGSADENNFTHTTNGTFKFSDPGINDSHTVTVTPSDLNYQGTLTASIGNSATGDGTGSIDWNFTASDSALDFLSSGQTITQTYALTTSDDDGGTADKSLRVNITGTNDDPTVADGIGNKIAAEDSEFNFIVPADTFNDVDAGDSLTYTATLGNGDALLGWLAFDETNQTFSGTPRNGDVGSLSLKVTATDSANASVSNTFNLEVNNVNDPPTVATEIDNQTTAEDDPFSFNFPLNTFEDVDAGDTLTYTANSDNGAALPGWLDFDADTRTFSGTPTNGDVGSLSLKVTATDAAGATDSDTFDLSVTNVNDAPRVLIEIDDQTTGEDDPFSFTVRLSTFDDADAGDTLTYTASLDDGTALPDWLDFNPATLTFRGTPTNDDVGSRSLKVTATDSANASVSDTFELSVTNVNDAPDLTNNNGLTLKERTTSTITNSLLNVTDVDNTPDDITYTVTNLPDFGALKLDGVALAANSTFTQANINASALTYTHNPIETASDNFTFTVTDGAGDNIGATVFNIGVTPVNETLNGTIRNDTINGLAGNDSINGLAGSDNLSGGSGNDTITGGSSNDNLTGNTGFDILTGGSGADRFIFNSKNEGRDGIIDFSVVDDTLMVSKAGFGGRLTANAAIAPAQFQLGSSAIDSSDRFIYNKNTGNLFFDADGIGASAQIQFAQLSTGLNMTYRDILVGA